VTLPDVPRAAAVAAAVSGIPSTAHALATRRDPLEGALAAGTLLLPHERRRAPLLVSATVAHIGLSLGWAVALAQILPAGRELRWAAPAGLAIAALDLGLVGRRFPRIRALPLLPQVADHLAYSLAVAAVLRHRRALGA
jgi:hypothetical protein